MNRKNLILWFEDEPDHSETQKFIGSLQDNFKFCLHPHQTSVCHSIYSGILYLLESAYGENKEIYPLPQIILLDSKLKDIPSGENYDKISKKIMSLCGDNDYLIQDVKRCFEEQNGGAVIRLFGRHIYPYHKQIKIFYLSIFAKKVVEEKYGGEIFKEFPGILIGYLPKNISPNTLVSELYEVLHHEKRGLSLEEIRKNLSKEDADFLLGTEEENFEWSDKYRLALTDLIFAGMDKAWQYIDNRKTKKPYFELGKDTEFTKVLKSHRELPRALILGERGSGKERFSSILHNLWYQYNENADFVTINLGGVPTWSAGAALPLRLFGGKLQKDQTEGYGCVPQAWNGTLMLDELGDAKSDVQDTLLRLIQEGDYEPIHIERKVWAAHCCIIGATNQQILNFREEDIFRQDVIDRLAMHIIIIPSLNETKEDLQNWMQKISKYVADKHNQLNPNNLFPWEFDFIDAATNIVQGYEWEGNLRQLTNAIRRMQARAGEAGKTSIPIPYVYKEISRLTERKPRIYMDSFPALPTNEEELISFIQSAAEYLHIPGKKILSKSDIQRFVESYLERTMSLYQINSYFERTFGKGAFDRLFNEIARISGLNTWGENP